MLPLSLVDPLKSRGTIRAVSQLFSSSHRAIDFRRSLRHSSRWSPMHGSQLDLWSYGWGSRPYHCSEWWSKRAAGTRVQTDCCYPCFTTRWRPCDSYFYS